MPQITIHNESGVVLRVSAGASLAPTDVKIGASLVVNAPNGTRIIAQAKFVNEANAQATYVVATANKEVDVIARGKVGVEFRDTEPDSDDDAIN